MINDEPQQTEWESKVGLSEETTYVALYPNRKHAEEVIWILRIIQQLAQIMASWISNGKLWAPTSSTGIV